LSALIRAVARQPAITSCAFRSMVSSAASDRAAISSAVNSARSASPLPCSSRGARRPGCVQHGCSARYCRRTRLQTCPLAHLGSDLARNCSAELMCR
jgi:hypothetical protein